MPNAADGLEQRLAQLDLLLRWEGRLNNARVRELFGLSPVRASEWIREFREQHRRWLRWDSKTRSYYVTPMAFRHGEDTIAAEANESESLSRYLALTGLPHALDQPGGERVVWAAFPELAAPRARIFSALSEAVRVRHAVEITYRSMGEPQPHKRLIFPHSLVRAGRRWHTRAFCDSSNAFRDYTLGRIVAAQLLDQPAVHSETDDEAWQARVPVRLIAHPDLTPAQEDVIRFEYFNDTASRVVTCRGALVEYLIQDIRAAVDLKLQRPPDYQIAVGNVNEVQRWLFPA